MSKIGKQPIHIPEDIDAKIEDGILSFKKDGENVQLKILPYVKAEIKDKILVFGSEREFKQAFSNWGTMRSLAANAIEGLTKDFEKVLELEGIGYRAVLEGTTLILNIGFSHQIKFNPPTGIKISVEKNTIKVSGISKSLVGETAAKIKHSRKAEPYKGKGIRYKGEIIRRKSGKKVAGTEKI